MNEEQKKWDVVPFDTFEQYLGPRYENVPGVEYILEMERFSISWRKPPAYMNPPIIL